MYIEQAFKGKSSGARYLFGTIAIFFSWVILQTLPFIIALGFKYGYNEKLIAVFSDQNRMMSDFSSNTTFFFMLLGFALSLLVLFLLNEGIHKNSITNLTTSRNKIDWSRFWFSFSTIAILNVILILVDYFFVSPDDYVFNFNLVPFLILMLIAVVFVPLQTSFEEYFFRGYLMQGIGIKTGYRWIPLVITSFIFGAMHYANPEVTQMGDLVMVSYFGTAIMLGVMTLMDEGLELSLGFHAANNLVASLLVTADWTAFNTESILRDISNPTADWEVWIGALVINPIILLIYAKRYKWNNWGTRLFGKVQQPIVSQVSEINDIEDLSEIKKDY
ncbi:CPBP family intramembrane glutamic endopeptidase [Zunongwangia endophytica]|uniref:CPBP family intramembrane glutamic endopeptidase n=1 Tax=Zunongwangia endophytica TaxID=1808945 RepID=A0ABV8HBC3_9FLAO|nr:CPBP family intramembrane glutamic endopeptidase [Zunongwangia endophytica]MDN3594939.1 CPBP family intramembrane metalloprotease [Zunongwangia endophytica]